MGKSGDWRGTCRPTASATKKLVAAKTIKRYDKPKTPFQRVLEADSKFVSNKKKRELKKIFDSLNPFLLREAMEKKIDKIFKKLHSSR